MNFSTLPNEVMFNVGGFVPVEGRQTRQTVTRVNPYDPGLITEMLELGLDPATIIAKERLRQRELRRLQATIGWKLAQYLHQQGAKWYMEGSGGPEIFLQIKGSLPFPVNALQTLGLVVSDIGYNGTAAVVTDPQGSQLYRDLARSDWILSGLTEPPIDDPYDSY